MQSNRVKGIAEMMRKAVGGEFTHEICDRFEENLRRNPPNETDSLAEESLKVGMSVQNAFVLPSLELGGEQDPWAKICGWIRKLEAIYEGFLLRHKAGSSEPEVVSKPEPCLGTYIDIASHGVAWNDLFWREFHRGGLKEKLALKRDAEGRGGENNDDSIVLEEATDEFLRNQLDKMVQYELGLLEEPPLSLLYPKP